MDSNQALTKKQLKELRKLENLKRENLEKNQSSMKWIVIGIVTVLFLGFFTFLIVSAKQQTQQSQASQLTSSGWVRGDPKAKNTLIEFGDIQCPACKAAEPFVEQILKDDNGKLKLLYKQFPLTSVHIHAMEGAIALEAAGKQGKFWPMHDLLFAKQEEWGGAQDAGPYIQQYAKSLGLNMAEFNKDIKDKALADKVNASENEGIAVGVNATPTFYINGVQLDPTKISTYDGFKSQIESKLK